MCCRQRRRCGLCRCASAVQKPHTAAAQVGSAQPETDLQMGHCVPAAPTPQARLSGYPGPHSTSLQLIATPPLAGCSAGWSHLGVRRAQARPGRAAPSRTRSRAGLVYLGAAARCAAFVRCGKTRRRSRAGQPYPPPRRAALSSKTAVEPWSRARLSYLTRSRADRAYPRGRAAARLRWAPPVCNGMPSSRRRPRAAAVARWPSSSSRLRAARPCRGPHAVVAPRRRRQIIGNGHLVARRGTLGPRALARPTPAKVVARSPRLQAGPAAAPLCCRVVAPAGRTMLPGGGDCINWAPRLRHALVHCRCWQRVFLNMVRGAFRPGRARAQTSRAPRKCGW